jgi:hypothetical protein
MAPAAPNHDYCCDYHPTDCTLPQPDELRIQQLACEQESLHTTYARSELINPAKIFPVGKN